MGRSSYSTKTEADWLKKIEIVFLKKYGYLCWWNRGTLNWTNKFSETQSSITIETSINPADPHIRFLYTRTDHDTGGKKDFDYKVNLVSTHCHYGGERYWFICPLSVNGNYCGKRVGVLYKGGDYFGCRHCYDLTYDSKKENRRYKHYPLFFMLHGYNKIEKLENQIKRKQYAGKPTKKQLKIIAVQLKMLQSAPLVKNL